MSIESFLQTGTYQLISSDETQTYTTTQSSSKNEVNTNSFSGKTSFESIRSVDEIRSQNSVILPKIKDTSNIWDQAPIDFSLRVFHPHPVKRNTREAIKPWTYDKFLKTTEEKSIFDNSGGDGLELDNSLSKQRFSQLVSDFNSGSSFDEATMAKEDFQAFFRLLTANQARAEAAQTMGYRETLDLGVYKLPKIYEHREIKPPPYGVSDFQTIFEADPFNIKFLTANLDKIHGGVNGVTNLTLRDSEPGAQLGDAVKKAEPRYDPKLILPRLPFPNKFYGTTRHRPINRSVASAYWDRALPQINQKWANDQNTNNSLKRSGSLRDTIKYELKNHAVC